MKVARPFLVLWVVVVAVLFLVEIAEVTQLFTLPLQSVVGNPVAFVFSLALTTLLALVGAIFIGLYISQRWLHTRDFTPFEVEMLRMREDITELKAAVERLPGAPPPKAPPRSPP
ncbi:MAG: hypothetical protein ACREBZ_06940 [Thermoplasmata archaeon]